MIWKQLLKGQRCKRRESRKGQARKEEK